MAKKFLKNFQSKCFKKLKWSKKVLKVKKLMSKTHSNFHIRRQFITQNDWKN